METSIDPTVFNEELTALVPLNTSVLVGVTAEANKEEAIVVGHGEGVCVPEVSTPKLEEMSKFTCLSRDGNPQEIFEKFKQGEECFIVCDLESGAVCVGRLKDIVAGFHGEKVNIYISPRF